MKLPGWLLWSMLSLSVVAVLGYGAWSAQQSALPHMTEPPIRCLVFAADKSLLYAGCEDGAVRTFTIVTEPLRAQQEAVWAGHERPVLSIAVSSDDSRMATGDEEGTVKLWDLRTKDKVTLSASSAVRWLCFSKDGAFLATRGNFSIVWKATGSFDKVLAVPACYLAFSDDSKSLTIRRGADDSFEELDNKQANEHARRFLWTSPFLPDGIWEFRAGGGWAGSRVVLWNVNKREQRFMGWHLTDGKAPGISASAISPDGCLVVTAALDGSIRSWDIESAFENCPPDSNEAVKRTSKTTGVCSGVTTTTLMLLDRPFQRSHFQQTRSYLPQRGVTEQSESGISNRTNDWRSPEHTRVLMRLPRWLVVTLLSVSLLALLGAGAWWWVTWPETRCSREYVTRQIILSLAQPLKAEHNNASVAL
jgi:WD domain, G-beta repeat